MSFIHMDAVTAASAVGSVVTLSGGNSSDSDAIEAIAGFEFRSAGTVFRNRGNTLTQSSATTDWIIPNSDAAVDYQVRASGGAGISYDSTRSEGISLGTWYTLDVTRKYIFSCDRLCSQNGNFIVDIRWQTGTDPRNNVSSLFDSASVMATATYTIGLEAN